MGLHRKRYHNSILKKNKTNLVCYTNPVSEWAALRDTALPGIWKALVGGLLGRTTVAQGMLALDR